MRRSHFIPMLFLLGLLAACGRPQAPASATMPAGQQAYSSHVASANAGQPTIAASLTPATDPSPSTVPTRSPVPTHPVAETASRNAGQNPKQVITIDFPKPNSTISSPLTLSGSTNFWPFEANLSAQLKDAQGNLLAQIPVTVHSPDMGQGGPWSERLTFTPPAQPRTGTLEVFDASAKDGTVTSIARVNVRLVPAAAPGTTLDFEWPKEGSVVTTPLHVALGGARGDEELTLRLVQDGSARLRTKVRAELGYVVTTIPGSGIAGPATLDVLRNDGSVLAQRRVRVAAPAETQPVKVAWISKGHENLVLEERHVPRTSQIGTAALNELMWGPEPGSAFSTALPTPAEVLGFEGRAAGWGSRVRLLKLTITNGVARANFSPELRAYGGGAARVTAIRKQIETTLLQFSSVKQVVIAIDGQTDGVLEP
jgi:hypothetical protein